MKTHRCSEKLGYPGVCINVLTCKQARATDSSFVKVTNASPFLRPSGDVYNLIFLIFPFMENKVSVNTYRYEHQNTNINELFD
jgi:hypothetical protein